MAKVLGIGGVFFKSPDPARLYAWYREYLGLETSQWGVIFSPSAIPSNGHTVWSAFKEGTDYFAPGKDFMFNLIVDNLEEALETVKRGGATIPKPSETHPYGKFGWFIDLDGNKVELWEPTPGATDQ